MDSRASALATLAVVIGATHLALVWAVRTHRLPRNPLIGIRLPALLASDEAWEKGHRAAVQPLLALAPAGIVLGLASLPLTDPASSYTASAAIVVELLALALAVRAALRAV